MYVPALTVWKGDFLGHYWRRECFLGNILMNSTYLTWIRNLLYSYCCVWDYANAKSSQCSDSFMMANISISKCQEYKALAISWEPLQKEDILRMYGTASNKIHWFIASPSQAQNIKLLRNYYWILRRTIEEKGTTT